MRFIFRQILLVTIVSGIGGHRIGLAETDDSSTNNSSTRPADRLLNPDGVYVRVEQVRDFDDIVVVFEDRRVSMRLANVVPLSSWSKVGDERAERLRTEAIQYAQKALVGKEVFLKVQEQEENKEKPSVNLFWTARHPGESAWTGKMPSERIGWGMTCINIALAEKGYTVFALEGDALPKRIVDLYKEAEQGATDASAGIWSVDGLPGQVEQASEAK